jgi:hypothetical protein
MFQNKTITLKAGKGITHKKLPHDKKHTTHSKEK